MQTFLKILVSLFVMASIALTNLNALNFDEMIAQEFIAPSFDCSKVIDNDKHSDELYICNKIGVINAYENKRLALVDSFYSSYYKIIINNVDFKHQSTIKQISLNMIQNRKECLKLEDVISESLPDDANPIIPLLETTACMQKSYIQAFRQITHFIYNTPAHKPIFEKIFYPNPKEYYESIMTKRKDYDYNALSDIIKKATNDNLVDKNGALVGDSHTDSHKSSGNLKNGVKQ